MQCAKCGTTNRSGAKFCEECGTRLTFPCPHCSAIVHSGQKFCGDCGTSLTQPSAVSRRPSAVDPPQPPAPGIQYPATRRQTRDARPILYTPKHLAERILAERAAMEARGASDGERKIITALFADIKGSMDIMEDLDPEDARRLLDPCLQRMIDAVHRAEGTVNRVLGDGILALFGAPLALEDHAHRALYAALRMHEAVGRYAAELQESYGIPLKIRIGINTGEVVVRTIGNDLYMDYSAVGHAVGLAARMETLATPGSTLVTVHTYRLAQDAFRFVARGEVKVKGLKTTLPVYELLGSGLSRSRLATRTAYGFTPFVGRTQDLARMREIADLARSGQGQVIALVGEAGVGKSRLLEELKPVLQAHGYLLIAGAAFAYGKTRAYLPLIEILKRYCEIGDQDTPDVYREKLRSRLAGVDPSLTDCVPVFLDLLGVDTEIPEIAGLSAELRVQQVLNGIKRLFALQSRHQPVALLIEDLQWLDARSLTFLQTLLPSLVMVPVLVVLTYRAEQSYPWEGHSFFHRLQMAPLPMDASTTLFTALAGTNAEVAQLARLICTHSGGNPFFLEEIVHSLNETGVLAGQPGAYTVTRPLSAWPLPATIQGVLASRLDRLSPALKALLQTASVIGREFSRPLLARVVDLPEIDLDHALGALQAREFLYETAVYPDVVYTFKHALTQEVAYHSLLQEHRTVLHGGVGAALEGLYADKLAEHVSLLAYHYSRSNRTDKALHYLHLAAQRSFALYADTDAQLFWEEHLRVLNTLPPGTERDRQEVRTRLHLINVLSRQSNDDEPTRSQFDVAAAACHRLGDVRLLAELHATLAVAYVFWGRPRPGLSHARTARQLADSLGDVHLRIITCGPLAHLLWMAGSFIEGLQIAEEGLRLLQSHGLLTDQMGFVAYPYVQCLAIAGACRGFLGDFDQGLSALHAAATSANQHGNRIPEALSHWGLALVHALHGDTAAALRAAEQALSVMQEVSPTTGVLLVGALRDYLAALEPPTTVGSQSASSCLLQTWHEQRAFCEVAGTWLATLAVHTGQMEEALRYAHTALARAETSESQWFLCTAHLTLGRILGHSGLRNTEASVNHLLTALRCAETMQSRPLCVQVTLLLGEEMGRKGRQVQSSKSKVQSPEFGKETRLKSQIRGSASERERADELVRAGQYLQQALKLGRTLGMSAACERAQALLTEFDIAPD